MTDGPEVVLSTTAIPLTEFRCATESVA